MSTDPRRSSVPAPPVTALEPSSARRSPSLLGNGLVLFSDAMLRDASAQNEARLEARVPAELRDAFAEEQRAFEIEVHEFLRTHNWSVDARLRGYYELTLALEGVYAWPVAAAAALVDIRRSLSVVAVVGAAGRLVPPGVAGDVQQLLFAMFDVLLRTNRMVFIDAALLMLLARRCHRLRRAGRAELALALLEGPRLLAMDDESMALARGVYDALGEADERARFDAVGTLTRTHFLREQSIVSAQMEDNRAFWMSIPSAVRSVLVPRLLYAPNIVSRGGERRLDWHWVTLSGADFMDHEARIREYGGAFIEPLLRAPEDLRAGVRWVTDELARMPR